MTSLNGQFVAVVGASSGIGLAVARHIAERQARVLMLSRSADRLRAAADGIPNAVTTAMDMLDDSAVSRVFSELQQLDHLVLTAVADELKRRAPIGELTNEQIERSFDKLRGFARVMRAAGSKLRPGSSVTIVTGISAVKPPEAGFSLLSAESGAIVSFGRALARELAPVRVNIIMSGVVDTPIHEAHREDIADWARRSLPARRFGQPSDIAESIEFAMTNAYLTGSVLTLDGGLTLT